MKDAAAVVVDDDDVERLFRVANVGEAAEIVKEGENGYLATTPEQWADRIAKLAGDPALRDRFGDAARETVEREYSVQAHAPKLSALLKSLARERE
jgi:glycosyltransferase involved in cell wall biosynthesis